MPTTAAKRNTWGRLTRAKAGPPGFGGGGWAGGPAWLDAYRTRRSPGPAELVESFKQVVYACSALNQGGVARTRLALYATTGDGQTRPKCAHRGLRPAAKAMLRSAGGTKAGTADWFKKNARDAEVNEVAEHPLLLLMDAVNDDWDYDLWVRYTVACLDVVGSFYHLPESTTGAFGKAVPDALWPLLAQYVLPARDPGGSLTSHYTYFGERYGPNDLIRGRCVSLRDPYAAGYGPTQAAFAHVGLSDQYVSMLENLSTQGARPSGIVSSKTPDGDPGEAERSKAEAMYNARFARGNAGKLWFMPGSLGFTPLAFPHSDPALKDVNAQLTQMIANCFGVPLSLLKTEDVNLANAEAGHRQHAELAVDPRCTTIASALTRWARRYGRDHGLPGWERLFFAFDNPVAEDRERNTRVFQMAIDSRQLTPNEARHEQGFEPYDGGDVVFVQGTLKPIEQAMKEPEPVPAALAPGAAPADPQDEAAADPGDGVVAEADNDPEAEPAGKAFGRDCGCGGAAAKSFGDDPDGRKAFLDDLTTYIKGYKPCRDKRGRFVACGAGGGGGKPSGGQGADAKPAAGGGGGAPTPAKPEAAAPPAKDFGDKPTAEMKQHFEAMGKDFRRGLSEDQSQSVRTYTGASYGPINAALRSEKGSHKPSDLTKSIDGALAKSPLKEDTYVYRGVKDLKSMGLSEHNLVGAVIKDKAYMSTTLDRKVAEKYADTGAVLRIKAPAGSKGASMSKTSRYDKESEVLFARNSSLKITGHSRDAKGRLVIHAELHQ